MALSKLGSRGITDGSILAADFAPGSVPADKLAGSIENSKLSNSTITIGGQAISLGGSNNALNLVDWQSKITSDGSTVTTMVSGRGYFVDNSSAAGLVKLPASASIGDFVAIKDYAGNFGTNNLTIQRNSHNIQGVAADSTISTNRASVVLVYVDSTKGWLYADEHNVGDLQVVTFTEATGGTVTTSGDYKIHTFTGDGNFVVSQLGNNPSNPSGGPNTVSYLVVAGGGGGGSNEAGGGGAGGYREGRDITPSYTASPLVAGSGLTISATTFPVTVGGGGSGGPPSGGCGTNGSNSVFSTITSTGGGAGGYANPAKPGGSGAGGRSTNQGGSGNTPPVSPPQGNNGGTGIFVPNVSILAGGGGGAATAGTNASPTAAGPGGTGVASSITSSAKGYSAGGGGGTNAVRTAGTGGTIPGASPTASGGSGSNSPTPGGAGTTNNGGGGGGGGVLSGGSVGGAGGSGIIVIRYKYQ
jgi:hypothetical protein